MLGWLLPLKKLRVACGTFTTKIETNRLRKKRILYFKSRRSLEAERGGKETSLDLLTFFMEIEIPKYGQVD
jgi:hypothetical protein